MRKLLLNVMLFCICYCLQAQIPNVQGFYTDSGYFFHPTNSRPISLFKIITQIGANTYQVELGDLGSSGYSFQFSLDANNKLVNWVSVGSTPAGASSYFMTADNPGKVNFLVPGNEKPGTPPWVISIYNNTYDPVTKTLYMHYGYGVGATGQNGFTRQVYEKYIFHEPPKITSFNPDNATWGTVVTIKGKNFRDISPYDGIKFGNRNGNNSCDSFTLISDSVIQATAGNASSGYIYVNNTNGYSSGVVGTDSLGRFTYTTPVITDTQWRYLGPAGISDNAASSANMAVSKQNIPYVVYIDTITKLPHVKKFIAEKWSEVGVIPAQNYCYQANITISSDNVPYVSFRADSMITVKKFDGNSWVDVGKEAFTRDDYSRSDLVLDVNNVPYVLSDSSYYFSVYRFNGSSWTNLGLVDLSDEGSIAINKADNSPYVITTSSNLPVVKRYNGSTWDNVGNINFTKNLAFEPLIKFDKANNAIVALQDDDGFERMSIFKLSGGVWTNIGPEKFSKSHSYYPSLNFDNNNIPVLAFISASYNNRGTVMKLNDSASWSTAGVTGFAPATIFSAHALVVDSNNIPLIAFSDVNNGNKVSVMRFAANFPAVFVTVSDGNWNDPVIWLNNVVPSATSVVTIKNNVTVTANATCYSLKVNPETGNIKINTGVNLTITH